MDECLSYPMPPELLLDEPAFEEADWVFRIATVGMGAKPHLNEPRDISFCILRHEDGGGQRATHSRFEEVRNLATILILFAVWPEKSAHRCNLCYIHQLSLPDRSIPHENKPLNYWTICYAT